VVDEAQDLSPMQCRVIARRSEHGSITLLGDLAQGTGTVVRPRLGGHPGPPRKPGARVVALTTGFRVPGVVVDLANRLLPALDVTYRMRYPYAATVPWTYCPSPTCCCP